MSSEEHVDPRYREPLQPGWWKTGAGWRAVLKSHRIDRRAKPVVIALILVVFYVASRATGWSYWGLFAGVAVVLIAAVLVFSPIDPNDPVPRQPLEPGWWKSRQGWKGLVNADLSEPGVGVFWMLVGVVVAAFVAWGVENGWVVAVGAFVALSSVLFPERYRIHVVVLGLLPPVLYYGLSL